MRRCTALLAILVLSLFRLGAANAATPQVMFTRLTDGPASALTTTEDGACLLLAHESANSVTVWDLAGGTLIKTISIASPRAILCRGDLLFVGDSASGTIHAFSQKSGWVDKQQWKLPEKSIFHLAALSGEKFDGRLLVSCAKDNGYAIYVLDTRRETKPLLVSNLLDAMAEVLTSNRLVVSRDVNLDNTLSVHLYDYDSYLLGQLKQAGTPDFQDTVALARDHSYIWSVGTKPYLFTTKSELNPDLQVTYPSQSLLIPDQLRDRFYTIDEHLICAYRPTPPWAPANQRTLELPAPIAKFVSPKTGGAANAFRAGWFQDANNVLRVWQPMAVTLNGQLYLVLGNPTTGDVYRAATPAFPDTPRVLPPPPVNADLPTGVSTFQKVSTADWVTAMAITDDNANLIVSEQASNQVVVWDVVTGKLLQTLPFPGAGPIIARSGKVFVGGANGIIRAFDPSLDWRKIGDYHAGTDSITSMTAAGGTYFKGKILISAASSLNQAEVYLLDTGIGDATHLGSTANKAGIVASYKGDRICEITESTGNFGIPPTASKTSYAPFTGSVQATPTRLIYHEFLAQPRPGELWLGDHDVYSGDSFRSVTGAPIDYPPLIVGDASRDVYYAVNPKSVSIHRTDMSLAQLGEVPVQPSQQHIELLSYGVWPRTAVTIHGKAYLFMLLQQGLFRIQLDDPGQTTAAASAGGFPAQAFTGKLLTYQLPIASKTAAFAVMKGPAGIQISDAGTLVWTPADADMGACEIKIRVENGDDVSFLRYSTQVVPGGRVLRPAIEGASPAGKLYLLPEECSIHVGVRKDVLVLQDRKLTVLDEDGLTVTRAVDLPKEYKFVGEREKYLVAVSKDSLDILDPLSGKIQKSIAIPAVLLYSAALNPVQNMSYVSYRQNDSNTRVYQIDEASGVVTKVPRVFGEALAIDPGGRYIYVGRGSAGSLTDCDVGPIHPTMNVRQMLVAYDIRQPSWRWVASNFRAADDSDHLSDSVHPIIVSPDGGSVAYLSYGGYANGQTAVFATEDVGYAEVAFPVKHPTDLAFHPVLPLVAVCDGIGVQFFDRQTGEPINNLIDLPDDMLKGATRCFFSPSGRYILVAHLDAKGRHLAEALPLRLQPFQRSAIAATPIRPTYLSLPVPNEKDPTRAGNIPVAKIPALQPLASAEMSAKDIGKQYMNAIVILRSKFGAGSGFFVSSDGYLVTCAHVLPDVGAVTASYRIAGDGANIDQATVPTSVIFVDETRDLALLKIVPKTPVIFVHLAESDKVDVGEPVTVIGSPGDGNKLLEYTMTTGIVSNPHRTVRYGVTALQTNAGVNPGNSGGPMFNSHGAVIGVVEAKSIVLEETGFAVAVNELRAFLISVTPEKPNR